MNSSQEAILYKLVLMRISGEPRTAISHRNIEGWAELKEFLQNTYIKRTLHFHESQLFKARQGKDEKVADWTHKVQTWGRCFVKPHCSIAEKGARGHIGFVRPVTQHLLYSGTGLRSDSDDSAKS